MARTIDVVSLYPKDMNIYGDSGNVLTIRRRLELLVDESKPLGKCKLKP